MPNGVSVQAHSSKVIICISQPCKNLSLYLYINRNDWSRNLIWIQISSLLANPKCLYPYENRLGTYLSTSWFASVHWTSHRYSRSLLHGMLLTFWPRDTQSIRATYIDLLWPFDILLAEPSTRLESPIRFAYRKDLKNKKLWQLYNICGSLEYSH